MKTKSVRIPVKWYERIKKYGEEWGAKTFAEAFDEYMLFKDVQLALTKSIIKSLSSKLEEERMKLEEERMLRLPLHVKLSNRLRRIFKCLRG